MMKQYSKNIILGLAFLTGMLLSPGCDKMSSHDEGILEGKISIGPICPVETDPPDPGCLPTAETYRAYPVAIWTAVGGRRIAQINPGSDGSYKTFLEPGNYVIILERDKSNIGSSSLPAEVIIKPGYTTTLNIDIDTGIR